MSAGYMFKLEALTISDHLTLEVPIQPLRSDFCPFHPAYGLSLSDKGGRQKSLEARVFSAELIFGRGAVG